MALVAAAAPPAAMIEVMERIDAVTLDDVRSVAAEIFTRPEVLAVVGPS